MVKFVVSLTVTEDLDGAYNYEELIKDLRNRLRVPGQDVLGVPVLPADGLNMDFFDVVLTYTDDSTVNHTIHVRLRTDNLYLVGYRPDNSDTWFEVGNEGTGTVLINEPRRTTEVLPFGANYRGLQNYADQAMRDLPLNFYQIANAIQTLAENTATAKNKARAVLTLIVILAEATRFTRISDFVSGYWLSDQAEKLGINYEALLRVWSLLSSAIQRAQNAGQVFTFQNDTGIIGDDNIEEAIGVLGIMHLACSSGPGSGPGPSGSRRPRRSAAPVYVQGQPLLEIFYVLLGNNISSQESGQLKLYGTISVTDGIGASDIWNHDKTKSIDIKPGEYISLEGPNRPLHAADTLYIDVDLQNSNTSHSIAKGTIPFNPFDYYSLTEYHVATTRRISGDYGSVTVSYMAMADGLFAQIAVVIITGDGDETEVYGDIDANNGHGQSRLFLRPREDYVEVKTRASIPLLRSIVAVPTEDTLTVNVNIKDWNLILSDTQIAWGSAQFQPLYMRSESKRIKGAGGEVEVQVTWL
ncbi:hypothetical protein D9757_012864 [Collybiopsis confluens]|uniref:rRNA N-glycosylase n=1 Tax=Collybiopsis confluens TaxID=2823264 RepID=A0A8H5G1L9_9AGAR|nr:hypothetical protein D9757_012864 [Collybiopsis confluens]